MHKDNQNYLKIRKLHDPSYLSYDHKINSDLGGLLEDYVPGETGASNQANHHDYKSHKYIPAVGPGKNYIRNQQ